nr:pyridoxamine 5'-phosphate oxidase family protein [Streptomyces sp. SID4948]
MTATECWDKLGAQGVGRVAVAVEPAPAVLPVNYAVDDGAILYRTAPHGVAGPESGTEVSFQVDRIDDRMSSGWTVLITGEVERIDDPETVERLTARHTTRPWAGGDRPLWIRIRPDSVTGRHIGRT